MEGLYNGGREFEHEQVEERASIRDCELVLKNFNSGRVEMDNFKGIYPDTEIERDTQYCERMRKNQEERHRLDTKGKDRVYASIRGDALETVIVNQAELNNWFGENSFLTRTSEFDDINNHVDAVLEFMIEGEKPQILALAIDTTSTVSKDGNVINGKIERNIEDVKFDRTTVKYFESQVDDYKGRLTHILPVVVGLDRDNSDDLIGMVASIIKLEALKIKGNTRLAEVKKEVTQHPAQVVFLEEIKAQLDMYRGLEIYKSDKQLENILVTINEVIGEKKDLANTTPCRDMKRNDRTYNQIIDKCERRLDEVK